MIEKSRASQPALITLFVISTLVQLSGCGLFDKAEPVASYIYVKPFVVNTNADNSQGSDASEIVDGWVYVDGTLIGVFELPAMVPVLYTKAVGRTSAPIISVLPGIKNNGLSNNRVVYPFYKGYIDSFELTPGTIDTVQPVTTYQDGAKFVWLEDFEDRSISLEKSGVNVTEDSVQLTTDASLIFNDGKNKISAFVEMAEGVQYFENSTISRFDFPRNVPLYLELNYKLDVRLQVGLYVFTSAGKLFDQIGILDLFPTDGAWQKTYISLAEDVNNANYTNAEFKIFFASRSSSTTQKSRIYFDNFKIVTY